MKFHCIACFLTQWIEVAIIEGSNYWRLYFPEADAEVDFGYKTFLRDWYLWMEERESRIEKSDKWNCNVVS